MRIILASASPRRRELLGKLFTDFEVIPAKGEECCSKTLADEIVLELSAQKALEIEQVINEENAYLESPGSRKANSGYAHSECIIIGADTVVAWQGRVLGKPRNEEDAKRMLRMLSGNMHQVYTGVTVILHKNGERKCMSFVECTNVVFCPISEEEVEAYVATGEPMDKAGSYGIQGMGGRFVERIEGDYENVVGLPVARLYQLLKLHMKI